MEKDQKYFDRDLSWLTFNYRVLLEAKDNKLPLYERIKFLGIYSSNLDEFFRVRVASLRSLKKLAKKSRKEYLDFKPKKVLNKIYEVVDEQQNEFGEIYRNSILPDLKANNIVLYNDIDELPLLHQNFITKYFRSKVLSYVQTVFLMNKSKNIFLDNRKLYFAVRLKNKEDKINDGNIIYAHLNIPSDNLPRFLELPKIDGSYYYIFLDDVIRFNLKYSFPGYDVIDAYSIKLNRDADLQIEDEYEGDLVEKIKMNLSQRQKGLPARFLYDLKMPKEFLSYLKNVFQLTDKDLVPGGRYHNLFDLMEFPNPIKPSLEAPPMPPLSDPELDEVESMFTAIDEKDRVLHFPYQSYEYVLRFFNEASIDPHVREIKITLYRIAGNSFIANSLISAARNGKDVTVFVEVKARFDEANNLKWASEMELAGIKIIYSIPGLKVHAKVALVTMKTDSGTTKKYAYLGTGNFNENTARIYADHGLFTSNKSIADELDSVFNYLKEKKKITSLNHLLVAKHNLKEKFVSLIDREIANAKAGKSAQIIVKLNNIEDESMIDKLYEASQAGVKIALIIRAICCVIPQVPNISENITLYRIVDRFLEHARVFIFGNDGKEEMFIGSADWMKRNLYRRIEVCYPVYDKDIQAEIKKIIQFQLADNTKAKRLDQQLKHISLNTDEGDSIRAQEDTYEWLKNKSLKTKRTSNIES